MYLQEEYLKRHNLINEIPLFMHIRLGAILFSSKLFVTQFAYVLMRIVWKPDYARPGKYIITCYTPVHNGYREKRYFEKYSEDEIQYERFYSFLLNFAESGQSKPIKDGKEAELILWQFFMYCFDGWFVDHSEPTLSELIYGVVSKEKSLENRYADYMLTLQYLQRNFPRVHKVFVDDFLFLGTPYSAWVSKFIEFHQKKS